ncbi:MAG: hypothetical protein PHD67_02590 [Oscillospiraceae bacterium]|nr:hypothetical protein [Oscillospiraceae bacterium]
MRFVASTGYLPVTAEAFGSSMEQEIATNENANIKKLLQTAITVHGEYNFYIPPVFDSFNGIGKDLEESFLTAAKGAREEYLTLLETMEPEEAYAQVEQKALSQWRAAH